MVSARPDRPGRKARSERTDQRVRRGQSDCPDRAATARSDLKDRRDRRVRRVQRVRRVHQGRQEKRGRPGNDTRYRRRLKKRFSFTWELRKALVEYDARCDGIFPLMTNSELAPLHVLDAYKSKHPMIEKRHDLLKNVQAATPVCLKSVSRVEALLFLLFVALLVSALIERELRAAMAASGAEALPLYPEERDCKAPTTVRVLEVLEPLQRSVLGKGGQVVQRFEPDLSKLQRQIVSLLGMRPQAFVGH